MNARSHDESRATRRTIELPPTSFVGRTADMRALDDLVGRAALVTVLGPPGTGKTRLVTRFAARYAESGKAAFFCDLTEATSAIDVFGTVSRTLELPLSDGDAAAQLGAAIAELGPALIVLDNFEQLVDRCAPIVAAWLRAAPDARFVVTSRQRLGVEGEALFDLGPLALPRSGRPAADSEAVQLFVERARSVRRGWELTPEDAPIVAELVTELDGLPLAIELCAARMRLLSPAQLLRDLPRRFQLLAPNSSGAARGLEEAITASWDLLAPGERAALASLSVFRGGMSPSAAEAVMDLGDEDTAAAAWPLDVLQALVDRSLVTSYEVAELGGERRFSLLVSIREFAANELRASGRENLVVRRHADHFLRSFYAWRARAETGDAGEAARRLQLEMENLLAIHRRAVAGDGGLGVADALASALGLCQMIRASGPFALGLALLDAALAMPGAGACEPALRARVLESRGAMLSLLGDAAGGRAACTEALAIATQLPDRRLEASILGTLGSTLVSQGEWREARARHERALAIHRELGDRRSEGFGLMALAHTYFQEDDLASSLAHQQQALALHRELGDPVAEGSALSHIGSVLMRQGRQDEARTHYEEALAIHTTVRDRRSEAATAGYLGILEQEQGRLAQAEARYEQSLAVSRAIGNRRVEGVFLGHLGNCLVEQGRLDDAVARYEDALRVLRAAGSRGPGAIFAACRGAALAALGRVEEGRAALDEADHQLAEIKDATAPASVIRMHRGHVDLALARSAEAAGREDDARVHRAAADRRLAEGAASAESDTDFRFARRALTLALDAVARERPAALVVARSGRWFQAPGEARIGLERRRALRLVLAALAERRQTAPGEAIALDEIVSIGWPGERLHPEAAAERAYNTIATLRRFGLRDVLQRRDDGYLLDPKVPFELGDDPI